MHIGNIILKILILSQFKLITIGYKILFEINMKGKNGLIKKRKHQWT